MDAATARRISVAGDVSELSVRQDIQDRALTLGLHGWVRLTANGTLCLHAEGDESALQELAGGLEEVGQVKTSSSRVEGHEQFAIRGVPAGAFVVQEHQAEPTTSTFDWRSTG